LSNTSQQSFAQQAELSVIVETAPPRIGTPAARFSKLRSALAASRRGADVRNPIGAGIRPAQRTHGHAPRRRGGVAATF
jgi:hypothetical protein